MSDAGQAPSPRGPRAREPRDPSAASQGVQRKEEPMSRKLQTIVITGSTGHQGGAIARELLAAGHTVRAMTRHPEGPAARALAGLGAEVVAGDLDDPKSLERVLSGAWG